MLNHLGDQVTPSFQALIQANPDLGTAFIREVCIRIGVPSADDKIASPISEPTVSWGTEGKSTTPSTPVGCGGPASTVMPLSPNHAQNSLPTTREEQVAGPSIGAQPLNTSSAPWTPPRRAGQEYPAGVASPTTPLHY